MALAFMSAYKDALHLSSAEVGPRLQLASALLASRQSVVVLEGRLALRPELNEILCEVISFGNDAPEIQVQSAKRLLQKSTLGGTIPNRKCRWLVVEDYGMGTTELWRES